MQDVVHHKTALQWAVERVASLGSVDLVRHLLNVTSTTSSARSGRSSAYRSDTASHLLNVAYQLPTDNQDLRRQLVQLLTDRGVWRRCSPCAAAAVVHW